MGKDKETYRGQIHDAMVPIFVGSWECPTIRMVDLSTGLCSFLHMGRDEAKTFFSSFLENVHSDDKRRLMRTIKKVAKAPGIFRQEYYRLRIPWDKGGYDYRWVVSSLAGRRLTHGGALIYMSFLDCPKEFLSKSDVLLSQSDVPLMHQRINLLLHKILETTQTAIFWKDEKRRFLGANRAFLNYYDFPSESVIIGKTDEDMGWHQEEEPFRHDELWVLKTGHRTFRVPGRCMSHGEMRNIVASKSPLIENGKIVGLVGSFEDVTDEVRQKKRIIDLNEQLISALSKARAADKAKTSFLSNVSHDMRTPLNGILGFTDLALREKDEAKRQDYLEKIQASGKLLLDLINDTLELSRIASGKKKLDPQVVSAQHMLDGLITSIQTSATTAGVHFETEIALSELGSVSVDILKLTKILLNLLSNAVKFTPCGGHVRFEARALPETRGNRRKCQFVVADTGIGMSKAFQARMYDPFEQEHAQSQQGKRGTGLGLSVARQLIDLFGGTIHVESQEGQGTTFTLELFLDCTNEKSKLEPAPAESTDLAVDLKGKRLLLCEDNALNREITTALLGLHGIEVDSAGNGRQGVDMFSRSEPGKYAAILMDIRMPLMDGLTAARTIRKLPHPDATKIPIIALSANAFAEDVEESRAAGMDAHLTKPADATVMLATLSRLITKGRPVLPPTELRG